MKVYELISYLQTFNQDAEVKFSVSEEFKTSTNVVTGVFFTDEYGYDCETEEQEIDVYFDHTYTDLNNISDSGSEVVFELEG